MSWNWGHTGLPDVSWPDVSWPDVSRPKVWGRWCRLASAEFPHHFLVGLGVGGNSVRRGRVEERWPLSRETMSARP